MAKPEVGGTFESGDHGNPRHTIFLVLAECAAETVRFKRKESGWRILILETNTSGLKAGDVFEWVKGANIFFGIRRLG
jgi:hypothetical protein